MADLAILVPVLARPQNVAPLMESIRATTPDARTIFVVDASDDAERAAIVAEGCEFFAVQDGDGYAAKIAAGVRGTSEPYVLTAADDVRPRPGWFEIARAKVDQGFGVVGVNDLIPRPSERATHFLLSREAAEMPTIDGQPGPMALAYVHNFPDRELVETATARGVYTYCEDAIVEHVGHPMLGGEMDATYAKGQATFRRDARLFRQRSALWAG